MYVTRLRGASSRVWGRRDQLGAGSAYASTTFVSWNWGDRQPRGIASGARARLADHAGGGAGAAAAAGAPLVPRRLRRCYLRGDVDGSADLGALLAHLEPVLRPGEYVFCTLPDRVIPAGVAPLLVFQEEEGTTLVVQRSDARRIGMGYSTSWAWISLEVHSSLEAVGLLAAVSAALAGGGISCNVVSAFHHDHVFVPLNRGEEAQVILREISDRARSLSRRSPLFRTTA